MNLLNASIRGYCPGDAYIIQSLLETVGNFLQILEFFQAVRKFIQFYIYLSSTLRINKRVTTELDICYTKLLISYI